MAKVFGKYGPSHPRLAKLGKRFIVPFFKKRAAKNGFYTPDSQYAQECIASFQEKLRQGKKVYLIGMGSNSHNAGLALVETSLENGTRLIGNHEEERFTAIKHFMGYPEQSVETLRRQMDQLGISVKDIHACLFSFNVVEHLSFEWVLEELPSTLSLLFKKPEFEQGNSFEAIDKVPMRLGKQLGLKKPFPIIGMRHHDNHAYFSYAASPFATMDETVMVVVVDGFGEEGAISLYTAQNGKLKLVYKNTSLFDSLGVLYTHISSTQGGWTPLSSEGRYMGAAAWGNNDRLTNPYYRRLRQLVYFGGNGEVYLNRAMANWHRKGSFEPYTAELKDILGEPISVKDMWNPDKVLDVENIGHAETTQERLDKAAATQMLFEDALFHIIEHQIRKTGSSKLVLSGGCSLNCLANMRLMEHFNTEYYNYYFEKPNTSLHLWVPPTPSDTGVTMGAAYHFALKYGSTIGPSLKHAFYCGLSPTTQEIKDALESDDEISHVELMNISTPEKCKAVADLMAYIISRDGILGIYQGVAETGPRALGHRSILANPCNSQTRNNLNQLVKFRELVRPLAPMATYEGAHRWFELQDGASDDNYNGYNYMILTARARPESYKVIPAVIHKDGTGRVQIVREDIDPLIHAYLKAMGRRTGAEVSVNTSLNVGSPIVQTPVQALEALKRSKGMHGLIMIGEEGEVFLVWHNVTDEIKDSGQQLNQWVHAWEEEAVNQYV